MADDAALRARRKRRHAKGDHSLCMPGPGRCDAVTPAGVTDEPASPDVTPQKRPTWPRNAPAAQPPAPPAIVAEPAAEPAPGGIETMARAYAETLPFAAGDPRRMIAELAVALARRLDQDGAAPPAVRELRTMLLQLTEIPNQQAGAVDELRLRRAQRRLDAILAGVEKGMVVPVVEVAD